MTRNYYSIYNIINFSLIGPKSFTNSLRYSKYRKDYIQDGDLDFIVAIGEINPNLDNCKILDDKYYIRENYFYCKEDNYKMLKWEIEIKNLDNLPFYINLKIKSKLLRLIRYSYIIIEGLIIDSIIHYILTKKGFALIHAACVSKMNRGILIVARGGAGKTTISTRLLKGGFSFVSDNFTIIAPDSIAMGFTEPLNLFSYNVGGDLKQALSLSQKIDCKLKGLIYSLSREYIKLFTRVNPSQIFPDIIERTSIELVFVIIPNNTLKRDIQLSKISKEELIRYIYYNQKLEFPFLDKYITSYSYEFTKSEISHHWDEYRRVLDKNLYQTGYKMIVPSRYDPDTIKIIEGVINSGTNL